MIYIILLFSKPKEHAIPWIDNNEAVIQCNHVMIPLDTDNAIYKLDEMTETFPLQTNCFWRYNCEWALLT